MPGIVGFVSKSSKEKNEDILINITKRMKYNKWFEESLFCDDFVGIGSIGFGEKYGARISDKNSAQILFIDGEIYSVENSLKKHSEMKSIPRMLLDSFSGNDAYVEELNGAFIIAIWDKVKKSLTIFNDRYGLRPLYYTVIKGNFLFSSEMKGMLDFPGFKVKIDERALYEYFSFGYILGNRTFLKDVKLLPPGSILDFQDGKIEMRKYWDFIYKEQYDESIPIKTYIEEMYEILKNAVEKQVTDENLTVGSFLSGGLDTRTIAALIPKRKRPIQTFTHNTGQPYDVEIAAVLSKRLEIRNYFLPLESDYITKYARELVWVNEGASDVTCAHLFSILDEIRKKVDVILDGTSGDMFLGSFVRDEFFKKNNKEDDRFVFSLVNYPFNESEIQLLFEGGSRVRNNCSAYDCFNSVYREIPFSHAANKFDYFILQNKLRRWLFSGLVNIRSRLEVRSPFYDNDFIDFYLKTPPKLRFKQYLYKQFLAKCFPELARIPQGNGEMIDGKITGKTFSWFNKKIKKKTNRKSLNFAELLRNESKHFITPILLDKKTIERGYFNKNYIKELVDEHMIKRRNHSTKLAYLVTFELWNRIFIDGENL